ncbi:uncharacterized protein WM277_021448 [Molossus nigricans]
MWALSRYLGPEHSLRLTPGWSPGPQACLLSAQPSPALLTRVLQNAGPVTEGCFCPEGTTLFSASTEVCVPTCCPRCLGPHGEPVEVLPGGPRAGAQVQLLPGAAGLAQEHDAALRGRLPPGLQLHPGGVVRLCGPALRCPRDLNYSQEPEPP